MLVRFLRGAAPAMRPHRRFFSSNATASVASSSALPAQFLSTQFTNTLALSTNESVASFLPNFTPLAFQQQQQQHQGDDSASRWFMMEHAMILQQQQQQQQQQQLAEQPTLVTDLIPLVEPVPEDAEDLSLAHHSTRRTYHPSVLRRKRKHGFLVRMRTRFGRRTLERRREKGRKWISV